MNWRGDENDVGTIFFLVFLDEFGNSEFEFATCQFMEIQFINQFLIRAILGLTGAQTQPETLEKLPS